MNNARSKLRVHEAFDVAAEASVEATVNESEDYQPGTPAENVEFGVRRGFDDGLKAVVDLLRNDDPFVVLEVLANIWPGE